jgi:hypothetical protein
LVHPFFTICSTTTSIPVVSHQRNGSTKACSALCASSC